MKNFNYNFYSDNPIEKVTFRYQNELNFQFINIGSIVIILGLLKILIEIIFKNFRLEKKSNPFAGRHYFRYTEIKKLSVPRVL